MRILETMRLAPDYSWTTFDHNGATYAAKIVADEDHGAPWVEECGHGPVSDWTSRNKLPGEFVLADDGRHKRFYDFQEACKIARRDGWDIPPYKTGSSRERATRAAMADYNRLRGWCDGDWRYVGVMVAPVCPCCGDVQEDTAVSLWGIESDASDYLAEVALDLTAEVQAQDACAA